MKRTNSILAFFCTAIIISFGTGCTKEHCTVEKENKIPGSFKMILLGDDKQVVQVQPEIMKESGSAKRASKVKQANGELIADGFSTDEFYVNFNAILNKSGVKGNINWSGSLFGQSELSVTFLNIDGNAAVVGGRVKADGWYFPKGTYIAFLVRDQAKNTQMPDQLNMSLYYSGTDSGEWLTPSSDFWSSSWYSLGSDVKIR